ncbi:MAG: cell division protein FtsL [Atopobiaceae bacterium]|nr:cell division protein FtsL [Atopobiaceae bacterium]MBR3314979.1 cell division protein FtsL [Atopobiaceae bacterium]
MRYEGNLAPQLEESAWVSARPAVFTSVKGGGLDAAVREGVSPSFFSKVVLIVAIIFALCAIGMARVTLTAGTVAMLQANDEVSSQIKDLRTLNADLRIERSLFSGSERIGRIATQNLGMVHASEVDCLTLD